MDPITVTPAQARVVAGWCVEGEGFAPLLIHAEQPGYLSKWSDGDLLVTQGDDYVQIASGGAVKDAVPSPAVS